MAIYTKTGDRGETGLFGGKRVKKYDIQIKAYGAVDELSSYIGLVSSHLKNKEEILFLINLQKDLYLLMSFLSGAKMELSGLESKVGEFERRIDNLEKALPKLTRFILPGGTETASWFHLLRVICRRAERQAVRFFDEKKIVNKNRDAILQYLNRLSDLFFVMARSHAKNKEIVT